MTPINDNPEIASVPASFDELPALDEPVEEPALEPVPVPAEALEPEGEALPVGLEPDAVKRSV